MTPSTAPATARAFLTDNEFRAIAYLAVGVGCEGSSAGRDVSNRLSFAGNIRNGKMFPVGNSGFSIGTIQTDLGQHPSVASELVAHFETWARTRHPEWHLTEHALRQFASDLARDGNEIKADGRREPSAQMMSRLNIYLRDDDGISFVHARDNEQIDRLMSGVVPQLRATALYQQSSPDDQVRLAATILKLQNQSGGTWTPRFLRRMQDGTYADLTAVNRAVDSIFPEDDDYLETGRKHAMHAAEVLIALRNADARSPLAEAWGAVVANPLVNPTQLAQQPGQPDLPHHYTAVKNLFLQPAQAPRLIAALDEGGAYAWGRPRPEHGNPPTAGLYASGDDVVLWNLDGHGARHVDGAWSAVSRDGLSRTRHRGGIVDLFEDAQHQTRTLMRVDPGVPPLRARDGEGRRIGLDQGTSDAAAPLRDARTAATTAMSPLLDQARAGVHRLDRDLGRTPDAASERMSASLALLAHARGLTRIDHVVLSAQTDGLAKGAHVFVIQGGLDDPARRVGHMRTHDAVAAPLDDTLARLQVPSTPPASAIAPTREAPALART